MAATAPPRAVLRYQLDQKMRRFNALAAGGFGLSAVFTAVVSMAAGYLTFGSASDGYILNNYAQTDALAQASARHRAGHRVHIPDPTPRVA